jgi:MFS family permease
LRQRVKGVFYGWRIVAAGFLGNALTDGTYYLGFSVFFLPISRDLDLSRAAVSLPFSLARITAGIMAPLMGQWIDRFGSGKVLAVCAFFGGLGFILLRWADTYTLFMVIFLAVISLGMTGGLSAPGITAVGKWFTKRRAFALAVTTSGFAVGGAAIPPLLALGTKLLDWRTTAMICGFAIWAMAPFLAVQLQKSPNSLLPWLGGIQEDSLIDVGPDAPVEYSLGEALRTRVYWQLALSVGMRTMGFGLFTVHLVAIMTWKGLDEATGGYLVGVYALAWLPALLVMGWMGDRWSKQRVAGSGSFIGSFGISLLLMWDSVEVWQMVLVLVLMAPNISGMSLAWAIIADLFGRSNFGALRGGVIAVMSIMGVGAPVYAGWVFDTTGGYTWAIVPTMISTVASGLLLWFLPRPHARRASSLPGRCLSGS